MYLQFHFFRQIRIMQGQLFTRHFIEHAIQDTAAWKDLPDSELNQFQEDLHRIYYDISPDISASSNINESSTERLIIDQTLYLLGWKGLFLTDQNLEPVGRENVPDYLLYPSQEAFKNGMSASHESDRYRHGVALLEAKRWMRPLDRSDTQPAANIKKFDTGAPSSQMLRYLSRADVVSDRAIKWGILSNGAVWRLYFQDARSRVEDFFEINIASVLGISGIQTEPDQPDSRHAIRLFLLMFRRESFLPQTWDISGRTFHQFALSEARLYEEMVSESLGKRVFSEVYPQLATAIARSDLSSQKDRRGRYTRQYLEEIREATLILLYRILFVMYAEDRRLLPVLEDRYKKYSMTSLRKDIAEAADTQRPLPAKITSFWDTLANIFTLVSEGDGTVGMPQYNGTLFESYRYPLLGRIRVPDALMAPIIDMLSRTAETEHALRINYRDLSVSHLGGIYERLLSWKLVQIDGETELQARPTSFARKNSGSYYTHDDLVKLVIDESVGVLVSEITDQFDSQVKNLEGKKKLKAKEEDSLAANDPATRILELKICDPAMGSGHFLVSLVDYLADAILSEAERAAEAVNALPVMAYRVEQSRLWTSDVIKSIASIRQDILKNAREQNWTVDDRQLDDRHIVRRMILKKVIFGVDKNPMAVELAKVALWLHTFTVGAPLSFLDHHLKCGDSLHGENFQAVRKDIEQMGVLFQQDELSGLDKAAKHLEIVADLTDTNIAEVMKSKRHAEKAERDVAPIHALLDFWRSLRWLVPNWSALQIKKIRDAGIRNALAELLSGRYNIVGVIETGHIHGVENEYIEALNTLLKQAKEISDRERFFHWQTAFPAVWSNNRGGFDAVIGNPPWDRMKLQQVEWFSDRSPDIARQARASDRENLIRNEEKKNTALWREFSIAAEIAVNSMEVIRKSKEYPLLSGGDINLYSLFVERAETLASKKGVIGLLVPSGIAGDKTASKFFRSISTTNRLKTLFDFENRKVFFPDVHASFKFCALVFSGEKRTFEASACAFFLHNIEDLKDSDRKLNLSSEDFVLVNPNTGTAPIFRTARDAEITTRIYRNHPVLVRHAGREKIPVWPVDYMRMFDMTLDSDKFMRLAELESQGWIRSDLNRWKKNEEEMLPLYEGKMVQMYDHRAADVVVNPANLHRPAQQEALPDKLKVQPDRFPEPQYWVKRENVLGRTAGTWQLGFKEITAPTNARTMIAAIMPQAAFGNKVPVLSPSNDNHAQNSRNAVLLVANLNAFAFDYVLRQKLQGQTINLFILEQLPVIGLGRFDDSILGRNIGDYICKEVLALTYTAHDMAPFARDIGYIDDKGNVREPFVWDAEDRTHRMARLDALFMYLYDLSLSDAEYILSTFPIVKKNDIDTMGSFVTRELILAYLKRIESGILSHENITEPGFVWPRQEKH